MCLIFFAVHQHPKFKLVIAANRDEFYNRKTEAAAFWKDDPSVLAGRDLEAGGTWLGVTTSGRISLLTNYRDPANINPSAPSRGQLVAEFLQGETSPKTYLQNLSLSASQYNGFNLMVGSVDELWYFSNYKSGLQKLENGLHGLSNHLLNTPWPKVENGKKKLQQVIRQQTEPSANQLFSLLMDEQRAPDAQLPETGIGLERERALSSMFIKTKGYGTRCSTVVLVDRDNRLTFAERVYNLETFTFTQNRFDFQITC